METVSRVPQVGIDGRGRLLVLNVFPWREAVKDLPGSRWLPGQKAWALPAAPETAARLLTILSGSGARVSQRVMSLAVEASTREERRAVAADQSGPLPDLPWEEWLRTDPWPHQQRGIHFLMGGSVAAIGASMGTGKSLVVVGAANALDVRRALFVVPTATLGVFPREFRIHSAREWHCDNGIRFTRRKTAKKLSLMDHWESLKALFQCGCGKPHAGIVGYEALAREPLASADLAALGIDLVVYDEAHRLKAPGGAISRTAFSWVNQVPRRWGLSGTLMPQGPWDVYGTYRALDPGLFGTNYTEFLAEWIVLRPRDEDGKEFPVDVKKDKKVPFSKKFHSIAYVPQVDLKLPKATHTVWSFSLEPKARELYDSIRDQGVAEITAAVIAAGGDPTDEGDVRTVTPKNAGVELLRFAQITGGSVTDDNDQVTVVSTAKTAALAAVLDQAGCRKGGHDGRSRPEPAVVFCRFRPDLAAIEELCRKLGLRYREVSGSRKDGLDADARMHPECDVLGAQIASGGVGVDFTRSRVCVWYSVGFELWLFQQAQKRLDRPGQTRSVANFYLIAEETVDSAIYAALAKNEKIVESCMWAYLRGAAAAERPSSELPVMATEGEVAGEPVNLPSWLLSGPPRATPRRDLEEEHRALALAGLEGF